MAIYSIRLELEENPNGIYTVTSSDVPGLVTEGSTPEEITHNVQEALSGLLEVAGGIMSKKLKRNLWINIFILILALIAVAVCVWLIASSIPSNEAERMLVSFGLLASSVLVLGGVASTLLLIWIAKFNQEEG